MRRLFAVSACKGGGTVATEIVNVIADCDLPREDYSRIDLLFADKISAGSTR